MRAEKKNCAYTQACVNCKTKEMARPEPHSAALANYKTGEGEREVRVSLLVLLGP